jgi:hypothetical protein
MKSLKENFRLNDLPYTLLKRNDKVALYGIGGEFTDKILHWEVEYTYEKTNMGKGNILQRMMILVVIVVDVS